MIRLCFNLSNYILNPHLSKTRDQKAAKRFFKKALWSFYVSKPHVITVDKNPAYPTAIEQLKKEKSIPDGMQLRQQKYLNNIVEQDHRFIKKCVSSMLGFKSFKTATFILRGVEAMHMIKKGQVDLRNQSVQNQKEFIHQVLGLTYSIKCENLLPSMFFFIYLHQNKYLINKNFKRLVMNFSLQ